jgi:hypothetical protein
MKLRWASASSSDRTFGRKERCGHGLTTRSMTRTVEARQARRERDVAFVIVAAQEMLYADQVRELMCQRIAYHPPAASISKYEESIS